MSDMPTRFVAIWKYDLFPYHLGGEVTKWEKGTTALGRVETKEFGKGYWFKPIMVLPYETGREILDNLKALEAEYRAKKDELHEVYMKRLRELI